MTDSKTGYFSRSNDILNDFLINLAASQPKPPVYDKDSILKQLDVFEKTVKADPKLFQVFASLKKRFIEQPDYRAKVDPNFVAGVMLLDLENK